MTHINYISALPGIGKTKWAVAEMARKILEADVITDVLDRISQGRISQPELNVKQDAN